MGENVKENTKTKKSKTGPWFSNPDPASLGVKIQNMEEYGIKNEEPARCLECGDVIEYGRQGRKFCCEDCKNRFNNRKVRNSKTVKLKILSALNRNYTILSNLVKLRVTTLGVSELQHLGFKFDYVTSYQKVRRHDVFQCFDISFTIIAGNVTSIEKLSINLPAVPDDEPSALSRRR